MSLPATAHGAQLGPIAIPDIGLFGLIGVLAISLVASGFGIRKARRAARDKHEQLSFVEQQLNDAEAALMAEPQLMLVWQGSNREVDRVIGSLKGTARAPEKAEELLAFGKWLEADSAKNISAAAVELRDVGKPFCIGIKTIQGELLEADGRAAGGLATLRFRPITGERRAVTELAYDADKLAKQVERLSAILDAAPFPVWIKTKSGELHWANQSYIRSVGGDELHTTLKAGLQLAVKTTADEKQIAQDPGLKGRARAALGGRMKAFNIYEIDLPDAAAGFALDVTSLEHAEKELERHINAHASTLDRLDTAIAIFGPDQRLRFFNKAYLMLWGLEENFLRSQPSDGEILDQLRAKRMLPEQANYREWKMKQLAAYTNLDARESYWYLPDGRSLHVVCEQHPFGGVSYLYENLTREYQLESRFNEMADVQKETLDNLAEAVALFGSDGRMRLCNLAFQKQWDVSFSTGTDGPHVDSFQKLKLVAGDARAAWADIKYGITGLDGSRKAVTGRCALGEQILRYRAAPLPDGNALITFTDVSDAARAEQALRDRTEALEAADRLKADFLAHVSHELRAPLTSIGGFAELLDYGMAGQLQPKQREYVLDIRRSTDDLTAIIDAIIELSAIDAGALELNLTKVAIDEVLQASTQRVLAALERRNQSISIEVADDVPEVIADTYRLQQVMGHLLSNAIGFSPAGSSIVMGARRKGREVHLFVADTGRGIDEDFLDKAFERFQARPSPGSHRGPGLGLSIVKSFTELHGGRVSLVSKPGKGTTVICSLPIAGPMPVPAPVAAVDETAA